MTLYTDLISYWNFDETSGNLEDQVASNDGTVDGCDYEQTGKIEDAYNFNGTSDDIDLGTGITPTSAITIAGWINKDDTGDGFVFAKWDWDVGGSVDNRAYALAVASNKINFFISSDGSDANTTQLAGSSDVGSGSYVHIAATFDGSDMVVYLNGSSDGTTSKSSGISNESATKTSRS